MAYDPNPFSFKYKCRLCGTVFSGGSMLAPNDKTSHVKDSVLSIIAGNFLPSLGTPESHDLISLRCIHLCDTSSFGIGDFIGAQRQA